MLEQNLVILGDINLDWIMQSPSISAPIRDLHREAFEAIAERLGGSGLICALAARETGFQVRLIGKIGTDVSGLAALDLLRKQQVDVTFVRQSQQIGTGRALIVRDEADQKAMVSHRGANQDLSLDDINDDVCANADAILVSGYSLLATPQAEVANWLIRHGRARGIPVVLDVVPHRVAKEGMTTYYSAALSEVNCLIVELGTAKALLGKPEVSESSVLQLLLKRYEMVILRPNNEEQILAFGSERIVQRTGYGTASNKTGYLDKVSVQVLYRWLSARRASAKEW